MKSGSGVMQITMLYKPEHIEITIKYDAMDLQV